MRYFIGIDIGGSHTAIGLVEASGILIDDLEICTSDYQHPELYVEVLKNCILQLQKIHLVDVHAIGIGAPNGNFFNGSIECPPNLPWKGVTKLAEMLEKAIDLPVWLTNDANAAAIGELHYGVAKEQKINNFIMITLGTGLGSGVVIDGELIYGHDGFAGEMGHMIIDPVNGRPCGCNRKGCLERYVSASGIVLSAEEALKANGRSSTLANLPKPLTALAIYEAALEGDELALELFDKTAKYLALALANATTITSPSAYILFGGLSNAGELLLKPLKSYFEEFLLPLYRSKIDIIISSIPSNQAAMLGAAALAKHQEHLYLKNIK